jgi:hypothetical protein
MTEPNQLTEFFAKRDWENSGDATAFSILERHIFEAFVEVVKAALILQQRWTDSDMHNPEELHPLDPFYRPASSQSLTDALYNLLEAL